ncbi:hypothetical protein OIU76_018802, partial [Salix suchowensis]
MESYSRRCMQDLNVLAHGWIANMTTQQTNVYPSMFQKLDILSKITRPQFSQCGTKLTEPNYRGERIETRALQAIQASGSRKTS